MVTADIGDDGSGWGITPGTVYPSNKDNMVSSSAISGNVAPTFTYTVPTSGTLGYSNNININPSGLTTHAYFPTVNGTSFNGAFNMGDSDVKVQGKSLKDFMDKVEERLAILTPNIEKLEHFQALREAYEHYKTLEALCIMPKKDDNSK